MVYNGYYKVMSVMSNIPKLGQLPTPDIYHNNSCCPAKMFRDIQTESLSIFVHFMVEMATPKYTNAQAFHWSSD